MKKVLWAPWRMPFIEKVNKKTTAAIFTQLPKQGANSKTLILSFKKQAFVILNRYPYTTGHLMVVPRRRVADFEKLTQQEHLEMMQLVSRSIQALKKEYKPQGFNIGLNLGKAAGAGIEKHLHYHIIPRWMGDTNLMSALANTRVIPESLARTYQRLKKYF